MKKIAVLILVINLTLSGCSAFVPKTETVSASCSEQDATLQINGEVFRGSGQAEINKGKKVALMCTKPGYFPAQKSIDYSLSGTAIADIVGIFVFVLPGIGLFTDGAWSLDETTVNVNMVSNEK
jgi:hypothetical protein